MKNLFVILSLSVLFTACGDKTEDETPGADLKNKYAFDTTDIETSPVENPNESFQLNYDFDKGKTYKYRLSTISNVKQEIQTDTTISQTIDQSIIYLLDLKVNETEDDLVTELICNVSSIKVNMEGNNQKITYESGSIKDSTERIKFAEYEALINNPFNLRVSKYGELREVFRADKIISKYLEIKGLSDSLNAEEKTLLRNDIIEGMLKPILMQIVRKMPENSVAKDTTWTIEQASSKMMIFNIKNTNTYKITSLQKLDDDKIAVIDAGLITSISGNNKVNDRGIAYEFKKPVTSGSGKIYFNLTDGVIEKSKTKTNIEIFYTMEANIPQGGKQKGSRKEIIVNTNVLELL